MAVKTDPQGIWKELENGRNFKSKNNLYNIVARNERMNAGDQWRGVTSKNLPKTTYNFIKQMSGNQVSSVMAQQITINRSADELSEDNEQVILAAKAFTATDKVNWERLKMDDMNEDLLLDAYLAGAGVSYWYWDDTIKTGNDFVTQGDINGELIDSINYYPSNPNDICVQNQDYNIISFRRTVAQVREEAKRNGVEGDELEKIQPDKSTFYEAFDKAQDEQDANTKEGQVTVVLKMWKEKEKIYFTKTTSNMTIKKKTDTGLKRYPIALMPWEKRKRFMFGNSPVTSIVPNQQVANQQVSMRHLHAKLFAIPKVGYNKNMITSFSNRAGGVMAMNAPPGTDLRGAMQYFQPTVMTGDVDKSIDDSINRTKELMGVNQNILGESNPENFRAIVAQQKAAAIPLESVKRRFFNYTEDVSLIWEDFYKAKYNLSREVVAGEDDQEEIINFKGTDFADIYLKTKIDVGASTQWSELLQIDAINTMWDKGIITDPVQYVERLPANMIPDQEKLVEELGGGDEANRIKKQAIFELMSQFLEQQPPEIQEQIMQLPPEQQEDAILQLVTQNGGV